MAWATPVDRDDEGGGAQVQTALVRCCPNCVVRALHHFAKLFVDPLVVPAELLDILNPLEIADGDAAGVGKNVRYHRNRLGQPAPRGPRAWSEHCRLRSRVCTLDLLVGLPDAFDVSNQRLVTARAAQLGVALMGCVAPIA